MFDDGLNDRGGLTKHIRLCDHHCLAGGHSSFDNSGLNDQGASKNGDDANNDDGFRYDAYAFDYCDDDSEINHESL